MLSRMHSRELFVGHKLSIDSKTEDEPNIEAAYKEFCHSLLDVDPF